MSASHSNTPNAGSSPITTKFVLDTLEYVRTFAGETLLIKLGGAALQDFDLVVSICRDLALIRSIGISIVLVHGGGPAINKELTLHGIDWSFIDGQRVTTEPMMDIVEMVLSGSVNRRIVRTLNHAGVCAVGISGTDARVLQCRPARAELGQVGAIEKVDVSFIRTILNTQTEADEDQKGGMGFIPVIAPVGFGPEGRAMNVNADWAASHIAAALGIRKIIYLTDQEGILGADGKLASEVDAASLRGFVDAGVVKGGMLAKTQTILHALKSGVKDVHILNSRRPHCLIEELFTSQGVGTICRGLTAAAITSTKGSEIHGTA
ncbi:MAG: acetylglutamate kinase [Deltaproteobacteria bacterium]|nr:acetylglutamate kinase [Deltaproteobacteria bacterium]